MTDTPQAKPCKTCNGFGYVKLINSTVGTERDVPCANCQAPAAIVRPATAMPPMTPPAALADRLEGLAEKAEAEVLFYDRSLARTELIEHVFDNLPAIIAALRERDRLREALKPFASIKPSSLYPDDGSEAEPYIVLISHGAGNPVEFTGADLARARLALEAKEQGE